MSCRRRALEIADAAVTSFRCMIATVPFYEIEIRESGGRVTRATHMVIGDPNAEEWLHEDDRFEYEGVLLRVLDVEPADPPFDRRLVCIPA